MAQGGISAGQEGYELVPLPRLDLPPGWTRRRSALLDAPDRRVRVEVSEEVAPDGDPLAFAAAAGAEEATRRGGTVAAAPATGIALGGRQVVVQELLVPHAVAGDRTVRLVHLRRAGRLVTVAVTCSADDPDARQAADDLLMTLDPDDALLARPRAEASTTIGRPESSAAPVGTFSVDELAAAASLVGIVTLPLVGAVPSAGVAAGVRSLVARGVAVIAADGSIELAEPLRSAVRASRSPEGIVTVEVSSSVASTRTVAHLAPGEVLLAATAAPGVLALSWAEPTDLAPRLLTPLDDEGPAAADPPVDPDGPQEVSLVELDRVRAGGDATHPAAAALAGPDRLVRIRTIHHVDGRVEGDEQLAVARDGRWWIVAPTSGASSSAGFRCTACDLDAVRAGAAALIEEVLDGHR